MYVLLQNMDLMTIIISIVHIVRILSRVKQLAERIKEHGPQWHIGIDD